jgi:hypothetical protein
VEVDAVVDPLVHGLLEREVDAEPHARDAGGASAAVRRLHGARAAARDDGPALPPEAAAELHAELVLRRARRRARGAEHRDRGAEVVQPREAHLELRAHALDAIGVRDEAADRPLLGGDELLVGSERAARERGHPAQGSHRAADAAPVLSG